MSTTHDPAMNDMYDTCPPMRTRSQNRVSLTNTQPSFDAKVVIMGSAGTCLSSQLTNMLTCV